MSLNIHSANVSWFGKTVQFPELLFILGKHMKPKCARKASYFFAGAGKTCSLQIINLHAALKYLKYRKHEGDPDIKCKKKGTN